MRFTSLAGTAPPHALISHLSPTLLPVEHRTKRSTSVVQTVPSVYGLAPRDYVRYFLIVRKNSPASLAVPRKDALLLETFSRYLFVSVSGVVSQVRLSQGESLVKFLYRFRTAQSALAWLFKRGYL